MSSAAKAFAKIKSKSLATLKKKADAKTSIYVRQKAADENGIAECYTCGAKKRWQELQCGHFISRNHSATRYDPENLRVQCAGCNIWGRGRLDVFAGKLLEEMGVAKFKALLKKGREIHQFTRNELLGVIEAFSRPASD